MNPESIITQLAWLFTLALPVATISWTVTHEEIFREFREYCKKRIEKARNVFPKKFFYVFTCEYCFSFYVTILILIITEFKLLFFDWRGFIVSGFSIVWIANVYMSLFALLRTDLKKERLEAKDLENKEEEKKKN